MRRWSAPLLAVGLTACLAACTAGGDDVAAPAPSTAWTAGEVPVLVPGAPGEQPQVVEPGGSGTMANPGAWNDADVAFVTEMAVHHTQALQMAELAVDRAEDDAVRRLAERISAAQGPEVESMQAWLAAEGLPAADTDGGHAGHHDMAGMATDEQLARLVAARGVEFDRMFLELMTVHHQGAITMAEAAAGAQHPIVNEMINDTVASQDAEIFRMQQLLAELPG